MEGDARQYKRHDETLIGRFEERNKYYYRNKVKSEDIRGKTDIAENIVRDIEDRS